MFAFVMFAVFCFNSSLRHPFYKAQDMNLQCLNLNQFAVICCPVFILYVYVIKDLYITEFFINCTTNEQVLALALRGNGQFITLIDQCYNKSRFFQVVYLDMEDKLSR